MTKRCKDRCSQFTVNIARSKGNGPYKQGFKWCSVCRKFFQLTEISLECPCCGTKLRNKPRINRQNKELYNDFLGIRRIE
ncbi:hypothetical protein YTPLAS21_07230 [Candidatus Nitrosocosmicus sp.]|nr:hypothetical protein YTPLAS21_07230 [Candidatus Nitrosocosmicus sp.]